MAKKICPIQTATIYPKYCWNWR